MAKAIGVTLALILVFAGMLALGGRGGPVPDREAILAGSWQPPALPDWFVRLFESPDTRLELPEERFALRAEESRAIPVPGWEEPPRRIVRFALLSGAAVVTWRCAAAGQDGCIQELCLAPGTARPAGCAETPRREGSIAAGASGGMLVLRPLGGPAVVERR
jgi:hypothetical protein